MARVTKNREVNDEMKTKLVNLLKNIFQFEDRDLDFGIYRIMNQKRDDIRNFIEKELIEKIAEQLELVGEEQKKEITKELEELKTKVIEAYTKEAFENGELKDEFAELPLGKKYTEVLKQLESIKISKDLEREIYNHIYSFFSRYYDKGDFLSQRRYTHKGNERYAIPYDGEEVLLHWANKDQYYIKSTLNFQKYSFKSNGLNVIFRIVNAEEEKANIKSDQNRYFVVHVKKLYEFEGNTLNIYFEYRPLTDPEKNKRKFGKKTQIDQRDIDEYNYGFLKSKLDNEQKAKDLYKLENGKTILEKNLYKYTTSNKADYFIHRDLEGFLRRELDFYLKNEVLKLEDLETNDMQKKLLKAKVIRSISDKIINFLSQIENFQKKIWEKKKFVITTDYVITLDKIIEYGGKNFYNEIIKEIIENIEQIKEWKDLFSIEVKDNESLSAKLKDKNKQYLKLPIDTKHFDEEFKFILLESVTKDKSLDAVIDGVLIKSENYHALNLLSRKYDEQVMCIYIDPPYNTGSDEFLFKDNYQHSSWVSMISDRLKLARNLLSKEGSIFINCDDNEVGRLTLLMDSIFDEENFITTIIWEKVHTRKNSAKYFSVSHDYIPCFAKEKPKWKRILLPREDTSAYSNPDNDPKGPWKVDPVYANNPYDVDYEIVKPNGVRLNPPEGKYWRFSKETFEKKVKQGEVIWGKGDSYPLVKRYLSEVQPGLVPITLFDRKFAGDNSYAAREFRDMFGRVGLISYPKPSKLVERLAQITTNNNDVILDFFAGSGTTAHAVMKLNKNDKGNRKFILVEMAEYFDTLMMPRIKKVGYSFDWKDGKPIATNGLGMFCKYHHFEQYEDALENVEFEQRKIEEFSDYFMKYMLDFGTRGSNTFLNIGKMEDPLNYKLKILETVGKPTKTVTIDLAETFNYLIGLKVSKIRMIKKDGRKYVIVIGIVDGENTLVVWRSLKNLDFKKDKETIEKFKDEFETDEVYINGDAAVKGFHQIENTLKSLLWD